MELPAALRHAVDRALEGIALSDLTQAAARLSQRYRGEIRDGRLHVDDDLAAQAYLATRLPATYAAIRAALAMVEERLPDFMPENLLDLGAGPGTALWAALDCWPRLNAAVLVEGSPAIRKQGEALIDQALPAAAGGQTGIAWAVADLAHLGEGSEICGNAGGDLVTLCYVLDELAPEARVRLIDWAWAHCDGLLLIVEPGTPAGWHRILTARDQLLHRGADIIAPCPHALRCPLLPPAKAETVTAEVAGTSSWCHFSRRVARSRLHRLAKQADVPWEDEKFIFLAAASPAIGNTAAAEQQKPARIIGPVWQSGGRVQLQLCDAAGRYREIGLSRRDGDRYKRARRLDWGDCFAADGDADSAVLHPHKR
ncbi:MAG TPA: small ribosomal subunit Rsm22 family protein [Dongiaceae bacterium]|nr:small ribosomal subunit Rsm22 family protein [Dongiaceae bacterium]